MTVLDRESSSAGCQSLSLDSGEQRQETTYADYGLTERQRFLGPKVPAVPAEESVVGSEI